MKALLKLTSSVILAAAATTTTAGANSLFTQEFYSVNICGTFTTNGNLSLTGTGDITLKGLGTLGLDAYGNGLKGELEPGGSVSGSLDMGGGASLRISHCLDVLKLVDVLEKQDALTEAEQAMVNAVRFFDPEELKDAFVNVAYLTGLEPNRMVNLLTRIPETTEEIAGHLTSGDPVDALRTVDTLESLAQDMPLPPPVRNALNDVHSPLADQLDKAMDFLLTMQNDICFQAYPDEGLQEVIDELCKPLGDVDFAERLQDAVLLIEDLFVVANDTAGVVGDSADTLDEVQDFLEDTVNVTINGIEDGVNEIEDFVKGALKSTVDAILTAVNAIRDVVNDIWDGIGDILDAIDDINPL